MSTKTHELLITILNWVFGAVWTSTWWIVVNIDLVNKILEFWLKTLSISSIIMIMIINRRKVVKELKLIFNKCPD